MTLSINKLIHKSRRCLHLAAAALAIGAGTAFAQPGPGEDHRPTRGGRQGRPPRDDGQMPGDFSEGPRGRFGERPEAREIPREMVDIVMNILQERAPLLHQRLSTIRGRSPQRFQFMLRRLMPRMHEYMSTRERKPEIANMIIQEIAIEDQLRDLGQQYQAAKDDAARQATLSQEIETQVRRQIEIRQKRMADRLDDFAERIRKQQSQLEEWRQRATDMNARTEELVTKRVAEIKSGKRPEGPGRGRRPPRGRGPDDGMQPEDDGPSLGRPPHGPPPDEFFGPPGDRPPPPPPEDEPPPDDQD